MALLDFDYLLVLMHPFSKDSAKSTVDFFSQNGIRKFVFLVDVDLNLHSASWILDRIKQIKNELHSIRPYATSFYFAANVSMSKDVLFHPDIDRLRIGHSRFLFLQLPCFIDEGWIQSDLNHLLFKKNIGPIFTSFDMNLKSNPPSMTASCLSSNFYRVALDLNYMASPQGIASIKKILANEVPLFPIVSCEQSNYVGIMRRFEWLHTEIGDVYYHRFCRNLWRTERHFFEKI